MANSRSRTGEVGDLLALLYETPFSGDWTPLLDRLVTTVDTAYASIVVEDRVVGTVSAHSSSRLPETALNEYGEYYGLLDPLVHVAATRPLGTWLSSATLAELPWKDTEYHDDFLRKHEIEHCAGLTIVNDASGLLSLALDHQPGRRTDDRADERLLCTLAPHLSRCIQLQARLVAVESQRLAAVEALERLEIGVVLVDASARILAANRSAERMSAAADGLSLCREGLSAVHAEDSRRVRGLILEAIRTSHGQGTHSGGAIRLDRPSGKRPYEVLVTPVAPQRLCIGHRGAAALIFVTDPELTPRSAETLLQQLYGLTPAEAGLAMGLMTGASVIEIAEKRGVSVHTVRAQLKSLLTKTGTRRQSELVRLLYRSVAAIAG